MMFLPIKLAMIQRKISYKDFVLLCESNGLKTSIFALKAIQQGDNYYAEHFNLFTKMYEILGLPPVTLDYLIECREVYNKLKPQKRVKTPKKI